MEATQVKSETTAAPKEDQKKLPELKAPKTKRKWVKRVIALVVIVVIIAFLLSRCMGAGKQIISSAYLPYTAI